jgi:hypothetical protein
MMLVFHRRHVQLAIPRLCYLSMLYSRFLASVHPSFNSVPVLKSFQIKPIQVCTTPAPILYLFCAPRLIPPSSTKCTLVSMPASLIFQMLPLNLLSYRSENQF